MLTGTRPIDLWMLVIELLVLAVICAEGVYSVYRHYHKDWITKKLFSFWQTGQQLQGTVPVGNPIDDPNKAVEVENWNKAVVNWDSEVTNFLWAKCSKQAVTGFRHYMVRPRMASRISFSAEVLYVDLESKLENLRSIMEKPEVYF